MSKIDSLNQWAKNQPPKQMIMLLAALIIGVLLLVYLFLAVPMEDKKAQLEGEYTQAKRTLQSLQAKQLHKELEALEENILKAKTQTKELQTLSTGAREHLDALPALQHDNASWATVLEQLLEHSVRLGVDISIMEISSPELPYIGVLSFHKLLHVEGSGGFLAIEKWIRHAEDMPKTMKLKSIQINEGEIPSFRAEFEVLGLLK